MNHTDAIKAHKLNANMVDALSRAVFREHATGNGEGGYVIHDMHSRTRKALHDRGLMYGHYYLTRTGVEVLATLAGNTVDMRGYEWDGNKMIVAAYVENYAETVTVEGGEPNTWEPEFNGPGAAECYFGCGSPVVAVFVDYVGRTEGLCGSHRDRVEGQTYDVPVTPENGSQSQEETEENMSDAHVFIPGVNALDMGERSYNRFVGIGESAGVPGSLFTYGLATAISAAPGMNGTGKVNIPCEFGDVITVRTFLGDVRYVVQDNRYSATGPRKGDPILTPYALDTQRCARCETHGDNSMPNAVIHGDYVCGYCVENTESDESDRFPCFKRMGVVTHKGDCAQAYGVNGAVCSLEDDETEDAGFVETDSVDDYAIVSRLTTGAGFHTVADSVNATPAAPVTTGTTHHTTDENGARWERFEHVLTVGDVVKVIGSQGVYEVHCLIPGLPVVYVLGTTGEPYPVPATNVYAL